MKQADTERYIGLVKWFHDQAKNANYGFIQHAKLGDLFFHERSIECHNTTACRQELLNVISDTTRGHFVQVVCIWTLSEFKPTELKEQLIKVNLTASTEDNGFGGDIMDPRVCTHFPDVKSAVEQLIKTL